MLKKLKNKLKRLYLNFKYRGYDPDICCCGGTVGEGSEICRHGGCRSLKEYTITRELEYT